MALRCGSKQRGSVSDCGENGSEQPTHQAAAAPTHNHTQTHTGMLTFRIGNEESLGELSFYSNRHVDELEIMQLNS